MAGALLAGLRELGYVEGKNMVMEYRRADGKYERLPGLAAEMVQMKVDVIVAFSPTAIQAAQQATTTIPIVMVGAADPVASGFVASLARPGGNITGLSNINLDVSIKYLELIRAAVPKLSRVTVLVNPTNPGHSDFLKRIQATEKTNRVQAGGLMSYGQSILEQDYRAATYIDKILKGAKPGDIPVEQPTRFELVINMKTTKALGLIMRDLLFRADKVIE